MRCPVGPLRILAFRSMASPTPIPEAWELRQLPGELVQDRRELRRFNTAGFHLGVWAPAASGPGVDMPYAVIGPR